jgi:GNAT superfamily N-acetyltransferase
MSVSSHSCVVRRTASSAPELHQLVAHLWRELGGIYPEMNSHTPKEIVGPGSGFVVAWLNGEAIGCGAWRGLGASEPVVAEIKRMFVEPKARGRGISRQILGELERCAQADGYVTVRLETGLRQPHAIRLYETSGYQRIEPYGRYRNDPLSVCFEKRL